MTGSTLDSNRLVTSKLLDDIDRLRVDLRTARAERDAVREKYTAALSREEALKVEVLEQRDAFELALKDPKFPRLAAEGEARLYHSLWTATDEELSSVKAERDSLQQSTDRESQESAYFLDQLTKARELLREAETCTCCMPNWRVVQARRRAFLDGGSK